MTNYNVKLEAFLCVLMYWSFFKSMENLCLIFTGLIPVSIIIFCLLYVSIKWQVIMGSCIQLLLGIKHWQEREIDGMLLLFCFTWGFFVLGNLFVAVLSNPIEYPKLFGNCNNNITNGIWFSFPQISNYIYKTKGVVLLNESNKKRKMINRRYMLKKIM